MSTEASTKVIGKRVYQRLIPLFLVSVITGIFIVGYFTVPMTVTTPYQVAMKSVTDELTLWATVVAMFVLLYAFVGLIIGHTTTIIRAKGLKLRSNSMICIGSIILFLLLGYLLPGGTGIPTSKHCTYIL